MEVNGFSQLSADMARLLQMMSSKQTEMSEDIIRMEATMAVQAQDAEVKGQILDLYV